MRPNPRLSKIVALATVAVAWSVSLHGQAAPTPVNTTDPSEKKIPIVTDSKNTSLDPKDEDIYVMSPFEVNAKNDSGYSAGSSLAGNRLNTDLRDVGSAVSVVTAQMLRDIGATSNESLLQYTTNSEVGNIYGNMANAGSGTQLNEDGALRNPNGNTRIRGLAAADNTIDYFLTDIPWDSYNTDRVDFQRGPNAILFGLGSPAGIINAGTKSAAFTNKGNVELRYSRFGSVRTSLDLNRVLINKELALRIDALDDKQKFQQKPAFQNDRRAYGALRYEPGFLNKGSAHTTLKVNYEQGKGTSNRPRSIPPGDGITPWFLTGTATGYDAVGNQFQYNNLNKRGFQALGLQDQNFTSIGVDGKGEFQATSNGAGGAGYPTNGTRNPYWQPWLGGQYGASYGNNGTPGPLAIFNGNPSAIPARQPSFFPDLPPGANPNNGVLPNSSNNNTLEQQLVAWGINQTRGINTLGLIDGNIGGIPNMTMSSITLYRDVSKKVNLPGAKFGLTRNLQIIDPSIFDFYNKLIDGPNKSEWRNYHRFNVSLSETFFNGDVGIEGVIDKQHYQDGGLGFMSDRGGYIYVDVMQYMTDGRLNPNFGRPFIQDNVRQGSTGTTDREAKRVTAFAKHDFDKGQRHSFFTRLLGSQIVTGLFNTDVKESKSLVWAHYVADNAYKDFQYGYGSNPSSLTNSTRSVTPTIYLGPSLFNRSSAVGADIPAPTEQVIVKSGSIRAWDSTWIAPSTVNPATAWANPNYPVGHRLNTYTTANNSTTLLTEADNPANYRGWVNTPITILDSEQGNRDANLTGANKTKTYIESKALNWQGYFWDRSLVGMFGYRTDTARGWSKGAVGDLEGRPDLSDTYYSYSPTHFRVKDSSRSWSAVLHLNQLLKQKLPLNVSFFYNRSSNFQPLPNRVSVYNNLLEPPTGKTTDFGILFSTKNGKYSLKLNQYETTVVSANTTSGFQNAYMIGQIFTELQPQRNKYKFETSRGDDPNPIYYHAGNPGDNWQYAQSGSQTATEAEAAKQADIAGWDALVNSMPAGFFNAWSIDILNTNQLADLRAIRYTQPSGLSLTESNKSKGTEIELYGQPMTGLRLTMNASKAEAVRTNVGDPTWNEAVDKINTALNTTAAGTLRRNPNDANDTALARWNANFYATWLSVKNGEGVAVPELRKWRANFIANYDFQKRMLKGVSVGGAVRWQDKVVLGYKPLYYVGNKVPTDNPFLATSSGYDTSHPFYGPAETNVDLWLGYSYRINKYLNWRTKLNVSNVGKKDALIPVMTQPDGSPVGWRIAPTMVWSLTNTLEF
jgi:hypothetical protein